MHVLELSALSLRQKFVDKWLAQKQGLNRLISAHREGIGRESALVWNPEWLKNGEKKHWIAMHASDDKSSLKGVYRNMQITPEMVAKGIVRQRTVPMRSFVAGYYDCLAMIFGASASPTFSLLDTGGTSRNLTASAGATSAWLGAASGDSTYSIQVGSSSTAVTRTDTKLGTLVSHGTTATTLQYGSMTTNQATNPSGTVTRIRNQRSHTGNTSSSVNIQETGMAAKGINGVGSTIIFCIEHNLNAVGAISAGQVLTVTKDMETTT